MVDYKITDRPIEGEVKQNTRNNEPQISPADFLQLIDNVLNLPGVVALKWDQYTPYFNDGDECVFYVHEPRVILTGEEGAEDFDYGDGRTTYELWDQPWENGKYVGERVYRVGDIDTTKIYYALEKLSATGTWESIARENFGDHAEVTATKDGFSVEYYEHD